MPSALLACVPLAFDALSLEEAVDTMRRMQRTYGISRFLACGPGLGVRLSGMASVEDYRALGQKIHMAQEAVAESNIELGFWCTPTLKSGAGQEFAHVTDVSGVESPISGCPLDPVWKNLFLERFSAVLEACRPLLVLLEDDFELSNHPGVRYGCFCKWHRAEFRRRAGYDFNGSIACRALQAEIVRDTLTGFAGEIRRCADAVDPGIRIGLCQAGCSRQDGDFTQPVVFALAGERHRPLVRVCGSGYGSDAAWEIPEHLSGPAHFCAVLPSEVECWHETDSYPHTGFFTSARKLHSLLAASVAIGVEGTLLYATQYLDSPLEDTRYVEMYSRERLRLEVFREAVAGCCRPGYRTGGICNPWREVLGRCGLPYAMDSGPVELPTCGDLENLDDKGVKKLLSGNVLLDGSAALALARRGFAQWLGVDVSVGGFPQFWHERCEFPAEDGREMYNFIFAPAGSEGGGFVVLSPEDGCLVWSTFVNPGGKAIQPGMTSFVNQAGGRIGVIAYDLNSNRSSSIFCYRKQRLLAALLEYLAGEPAILRVDGAPNVFTVVRSKDNLLFGYLVNLCADPVENVQLRFACPPRRVSRLDRCGLWQEIEHVNLEYLCPEFIKSVL